MKLGKLVIDWVRPPIIQNPKLPHPQLMEALRVADNEPLWLAVMDNFNATIEEIVLDLADLTKADQRDYLCGALAKVRECRDGLVMARNEALNQTASQPVSRDDS